MKPQIISGLIIAGLMLAASLALVYLRKLGIISGEISTRLLMVIVGLMVVWFANLAPKQLRPMDDLACGPEREQTTRRFSSVIIVIGGLLYSLSWVVAPYKLAPAISMAALGGALVIILARCALSFARR